MSDVCSTVKVMPWGKGQGDYVEINEADFDENVHTLFDASEGAEDGLTKAEIIADLTAMEVEHDPRAKRADLLALRNEAKAARDAA